MKSMCEMFTAALIATEVSDKISSPVIFNISEMDRPYDPKIA